MHETGYLALEGMGRALRLLEALVSGLSVDEAAVRRDIDASCVTITELADSIVRAEHLSFAEAHDVCSRFCRHMARQGVTHRSRCNRNFVPLVVWTAGIF